MLLIIIHIHITSILSAPVRRICEYATPSKYIGLYQFTKGQAHIQPIQINTAFMSRVICNQVCKYNDNCFATSYENKYHVCSFYNTTDFIIHNNGDVLYSKWIMCNKSDAFQPSDGRCPGFFVSYDNQFIKVQDYNFIRKSNTEDCHSQCLRNPLCGFVNILEDECFLVPKWPYLNLNITNDNNWKADKWTCADNFTNSLQIPKRVHQPNEEKCSGYWKISNRNYMLNSDDSIWLNFQTQRYNDCLVECNRFSKCFRVYFNLTYSMCVLYQIQESDKIPFDNMAAIVFDWVCVKNDSRHPPMNDDEKRYLNLGMDCYRIVNDDDLFIGMDECGKYPTKSKFKRCSTGHHTYDWTITESCYVNQSYWMFPAKTISKNDKNEYESWKLTKIFTGLQTYWLAHLNSKNFMRVNYIECRIFNARLPKEILQPHEIISRDARQALLVEGKYHDFLEVPNKFAVSSSQQPFHSCKSRSACTDVLRWLQVFFFYGAGVDDSYRDIPFNFLIDDDGHIYEARGWKHRCSFVSTYNAETICVAYIGSYKNRKPGEKYLNSLKKLIEYAVNRGHLKRDYKLYVHQDLAHDRVHRSLLIVIKNWYRYRGFIPENCDNMSVSIFITNLIVFFIVSIMFFTFIYTLFVSKMYCKKCKFLSGMELEMKVLIPYIPSDDPESDEDMDACDINVIIYERPTLIYGRDYLKIVKLIKLWFYHNYLNSMCLQFSGNTLGNYLNSYSHITDGMIILESNLKQDNEFERINSKIIICISDDERLAILKNLMIRGSCVCHYFTIYQVDQTDYSMNIDIMD